MVLYILLYYVFYYIYYIDKGKELVELWQEDWRNGDNRSKTLPVMLTAGMAMVAVSAVQSASQAESISTTEDVSCNKPGMLSYFITILR